MVNYWAVAPTVCRVFGWSQKPVLYWHLAQAFPDQLKQLMCLFGTVAGLWVYCKISFYTLLLGCPVLCSRRSARCAHLLLFLLRLSTWTQPSVLCKLAELDVLPSPALQAARGQGARPATAVQLQTWASVLHGGWGQEPRFKAASASTEKSIFSHKTRRGMFGNHSQNERVPVLS